MKSKGFTIIELLIAMAVISILTGLILIMVNGATKGEQPCDTYKDSKVEDLPVRCLNHFQETRGF